MGILSDTSLKKLIFSANELDRAKSWFQNGDWSLINSKILIDPFVENCLGPFNYDIHLGEEAYLVNKKDKIQISGHDFICEPNEIVLAISREYIGIPRTFAASILPRFSLVRKGLQISMTKIDPTWFGRIAVGMTNLSSKPLRLETDQPFCTLVFHTLSEPCSTVLDVNEYQALGQESIDYFIDNEI